MATYQELYTIRNHQALLERTAIAITIAAAAIRDEDSGTANHANRLIWAKEALQGPLSMAERMIFLLLADNKAFTVAQITGATDASLQTAVNAAVNLMAQG